MNIEEATIVRIPDDAAAIIVGQDGRAQIYVPDKKDLNEAQAFIAVIAAVINQEDEYLEGIFRAAIDHVYGGIEDTL